MVKLSMRRLDSVGFKPDVRPEDRKERHCLSHQGSETQDKGSVLFTKAVKMQGKGGVLATKTV